LNIGFPSIQFCFIDDAEVFGADETPGVGAVVDDLQRDNLVAHRCELEVSLEWRVVVLGRNLPVPGVLVPKRDIRLLAVRPAAKFERQPSRVLGHFEALKSLPVLLAF
jgi:hypothetical protein